MSIIIYIKNFILCLILFSFQSCFLIKIPVSVQLQPIKDTVTVYHFIVPSNKKAVDSTASHSYVLESKKAYDWITKEAALFGQKLVFKEVWASNKNTNLKNTFIYKVPSKSLYVLTRKNFNILIQKKSKKEKEIINRLNWKQNLFDSLATWVSDSLLSKTISQSYKSGINHVTKNQLFVVHLPKVKIRKILGFYSANVAFIGQNKSRTIAHESIHYLGASDLYIHKYWFGRRRKIVKKELKEEVMNSTILKNTNCENAYISNYTAYCIGWSNTIEGIYKPLLKQNLMAKFDFWLFLMFF